MFIVVLTHVLIYHTSVFVADKKVNAWKYTVSKFLILKSLFHQSVMDVFIVTRQLIVIISLSFWFPSSLEAGTIEFASYSYMSTLSINSLIYNYFFSFC